MAADLWLADSNILIRWVQPGDPDFSFNTKDFARYSGIEAVHPARLS